jgi:hypothetical protein
MLFAYTVWIMTSGRVRSAGHPACKREMKNAHTFRSGYLKGKKLVVGYRCRCGGNIMDLRISGV